MADNVENFTSGKQKSDSEQPKEFLPLKNARPQDSPKKDPFARMKLEEKITMAMHKEDFSSALEYLEDLIGLETDPGRKMYSLLQKIVCQNKKEIHYNASESLHKLERLMSEQKVSPETARLEGEGYFAEKSFAKGFALYFCACKLYLASSDAKEAMEGIKTCFGKIKEHLVPLVIADEFEKKSITGHVIPALTEVADDLKSIRGAEANDLVKASAWASVRLSSFHQQCGEDGKVIKELKKAISALESGPRCEVWGICLNNIGTAYARLGQVDDALKYYKNAISVYYNAEDLSKDEKSMHVEEATKNQDLLSK